AETPRTAVATGQIAEHRVAHPDRRRALGEGGDPRGSPARAGELLAAIVRGGSPRGRASVFAADVRVTDRGDDRSEFVDALQGARTDPPPTLRVRQSPPPDGEPPLMAGPTPDRERSRLLSGWCDGSLGDAELERLDQLLRTDPGFRDLYLKYMDQHA